MTRTDECDTIWRALSDVVEDQTVRMIFVTGEAGTGKSRLAEWMATRAHEVEAARIVPAVHTSGDKGNEMNVELRKGQKCVVLVKTFG